MFLGDTAAGRSFLIPKHEVMQKEMQFYHEQGFDGFFDCNPPHDVWFPDSLSRWLYHRLLWNVILDLEAAKNDFFDHYYGPAAKNARETREAVENLIFEEPSRNAIDGLCRLEDRLEPLIEASADDALLLKRVKRMRIWIRYCRLCKESEFYENVTRDYNCGIITEKAIRELLRGHEGFLVANGFMSEGDLSFLARDVVNRHMMRMTLFSRIFRQ